MSDRGHKIHLFMNSMKRIPKAESSFSILYKDIRLSVGLADEGGRQAQHPAVLHTTRVSGQGDGADNFDVALRVDKDAGAACRQGVP